LVLGDRAGEYRQLPAEYPARRCVFRFGRTYLAFIEEARMAAMKPRTGDGPLEVTKEGRGIVMRVPLEGGGRLVVEMSADEAAALGDALKSAVG
jgi:hypothetical protein